MKPFTWYLNRYQHRAQDYYQKDENLLLGNELCVRCEGTGNELYSMYKQCSACGGNGVQ